jgi:uncharacterized damage-inducible protein DinB
MDLKAAALNELADTQRFFEKSVQVLDESDSSFKPHPEMMTVAQHVAHTAATVDWFREGVWGAGWNMDFEAENKRLESETSFDASMTHLREAFGRMRSHIESLGSDDLAKTLAPNPILGETPAYHMIEALVDHTGHHRGALTVYARLCGKKPLMPYMD